MKTLDVLSRTLNKGKIKSRELIEQCLDNIEDPSGEGTRAFISTDKEFARKLADSIDNSRKQGADLPPYAGIPISIKDLFNIKGQKTLAGSRVLKGSSPAKNDSTVVARLRAAGFVILGRTNMTEFAYSGLGLNPHYGTPVNPYDRATQRIPGGSSSGAAISVTDNMASAAVGTDTGGSCRIPAAMCGITGYKTTASRIPREGVVPLSSSFDSIGTLAHSVSCCATLDNILAGHNDYTLPEPDESKLRIGNLTGYVLDEMDEQVAAVLEKALSRLSNAGHSVTDIAMPDLNEIPSNFVNGGLTAAEAYKWHQDLLAKKGDEYDPRVKIRIMKGQSQRPSDYAELLVARSRLIEKTKKVTRKFDVIVMPSVPIIAPPIIELNDDEIYTKINALALRNPMIGNFLDRCAISIPVHETLTAPVGLTLMGEHGDDRKLLSTAQAIETLFRSEN